MLRIRPTWVVLTCALFLNATPVSIFNDVSNSQDDWANVVDIDGGPAASFSTGGTAYNLTTVVVVLSNNSNEQVDTRGAKRSSRVKGHRSSARAAKARNVKPAKVRPAIPITPEVTVSLWTDNGGPGPGSLLVTSATTLPDTSLGDDPAQFTFPFADYPLTANTRYWIVVSSPGDNSVAEWWETFNTAAGTETATEYSEFESAIYPNFVSGDPDEDEAYLMQVNGDPGTPPPTPAPASVTLVLIGLGWALWYSRRQKGLQLR
jgi:hypothetical protein